MNEKTEFQAILKELDQDKIRNRRSKTMLYLNDWVYLRFKALCAKNDHNVSAVIEGYMRRMVDYLEDPESDRKVEKEIRERLKKKKGRK